VIACSHKKAGQQVSTANEHSKTEFRHILLRTGTESAMKTIEPPPWLDFLRLALTRVGIFVPNIPGVGSLVTPGYLHQW
jgi:hypothetical protein